MGFEDNSGKKNTDRAGDLREKYSAALAAVKLRRPVQPPVSMEFFDNTARKSPVSQELAAAKQELQDEFSKMRTEFEDIKARLGEELAAVSESGPVKLPGPAAPQAAAFPVPEAPGESPAGSRPFSFFFLLAAAVCAAAFGVFRFFGGSAEFSIQLPPAYAAGLCLDRDSRHIFFADPQRQLLFTVSVPEKRLKSMQPFPAQGLKGLAFDGASFWSTDGASIYRHGLAGGYAVLGVNKAGPEVSSLSWDGKNLWAASAGGKLTGYSAGEALVQEAVYPLPGGRTAGISVSDGRLWLLDPESGKLSAYKLGVKPELLNEADIKSLLPGGAISGFSVAGDHLWVVTAEPAELAHINLRSLKSF